MARGRSCGPVLSVAVGAVGRNFSMGCRATRAIHPGMVPGCCQFARWFGRGGGPGWAFGLAGATHGANARRVELVGSQYGVGRERRFAGGPIGGIAGDGGVCRV